MQDNPMDGILRSLSIIENLEMMYDQLSSSIDHNHSRSAIVKDTTKTQLLLLRAARTAINNGLIEDYTEYIKQAEHLIYHYKDLFDPDEELKIEQD